MLAAAWGGAALFLGSLLYFAYFYLVELGRPKPAPPEWVPGAVAINLLLFSGFALHHSVAARLGIKTWMSRWVPRHLERSLYVWTASVLFLAVCLLWRPLPGVAWQASGLGRWVLHAVQLGGLVLTLRSAARIDIWELAGVRQAHGTDGAAADYADYADKKRADDGGATPLASVPAAPAAAVSPLPSPVVPSVLSAAASPVARTSVSSASSAARLSASSSSSAALPPSPLSPVAAALEISGPYRWVRHPIYLGWVLMVFGAPAMTTGRLLFASVSTLYLIAAIPFEERSLTAEFGPAYTAYQRQVRWRLVPGLW